MWLANVKNELYPNPHAYATECEWVLSFSLAHGLDSNVTFSPVHSLNWYCFIGRILGEAMYEGILVDVAFAGFFFAKVRAYFHRLSFFIMLKSSRFRPVVAGRTGIPLNDGHFCVGVDVRLHM